MSAAVFPEIGLGTWRSDKGLVEAAVYHALNAGYRHIDCAQVYQNQAEVGAGLSKFLQEQASLPNGVQRKDLFIVSKVWNTDHAAEHVLQSCQQTLKELQIDYIDVMLIHWPVCFKHSADGALFPSKDGIFELDAVPIEETWKAFEDLVDRGLTKHIGVSNFSIEQVQQVLSFARIKPITNQVEAHPYFQQRELAQYLQSQGIVLTAYSPLGNVNPEKFASCLADSVLNEIAAKYNKSVAQVILRWGLQMGYKIIPKSVTPARINDNLKVFDFTLSDEDMSRIATLGQEKTQRQVNPAFGPGGKPLFG